MNRRYRNRLIVTAVIIITGLVLPLVIDKLPGLYPATISPMSDSRYQATITSLDKLAVKGRAPKSGYSRSQFGDGWSKIGACSTREIILARDLTEPKIDDTCRVQSGQLADPYTGKTILFQRGPTTSSQVQIDHVVALSNAWQTGAQQLSYRQRIVLANDPLELLAVDGPANQQKSDGDAATWLPSNKSFRCQYVARQIAVKARYKLWVTPAEKQAIQNVLTRCHQS